MVPGEHVPSTTFSLYSGTAFKTPMCAEERINVWFGFLKVKVIDCFVIDFY